MDDDDVMRMTMTMEMMMEMTMEMPMMMMMRTTMPMALDDVRWAVVSRECREGAERLSAVQAKKESFI
jgi:hypothetical protein